MDLSCPACRVPLDERRAGGTVVRRCGRCEGLWLDAPAVQALASRGEGQPFVAAEWMPTKARRTPRLAPVRYLPCAVCGEMMNRVNFARVSGVVLDVCRDHGVWFEEDELVRVAEYLRRPRPPSAADPGSPPAPRRRPSLAPPASGPPDAWDVAGIVFDLLELLT